MLYLMEHWNIENIENIENSMEDMKKNENLKKCSHDSIVKAILSFG